jgi:hypothetical protein
MGQGHKITMVVPETVVLPSKVENSGIHFLRWKFTDPKHGRGIENHEDKFKEFFEAEENFVLKILHEIPEIIKTLRGECHGILSDSTLDKNLRSEKFDLAIVDGLYFCRCLFLIPHRMGVPYVGFSAQIPVDIMSTTYILPSIVPSQLLPLGSAMSFFQRVGNLVASNLPTYLIDNFVVSASEFKQYAGGRTFDSMSELVRESKLWLVSQHPLIDFPKPNAPFVIPIGGLNASPPKPLPDKLRTFADQSKDGMVIVSFGGTIHQLPLKFQESLMEAAKQFPNYNFLLRSKNYAGTPPSNVMMVGWLPQNDVLGHPKTKLFITHCGSGGQHEALYHGVPMLGFPGLADQFHNAARIVQRGYGLTMSITDFTTEELVRNLNSLLQTDTYRNKIKHAAKIMHDPLNKANETATYWVDHIIKYGGDHLKIQSDLYGFQILMWDIFLFLLVLSFLVIWIEIKIFLFCYRKCCKTGKTMSKKKTA